MASLISKLIDLVFPPHENVKGAHTIDEESILGMVEIKRYKDAPIYTALPYKNKSVRDVIKANKFYSDHHAATLLSIILEEMLSVVLEEHALSQNGKPILIPIPSSNKKKRSRGKNQVERIIDLLPKRTLDSFAYEKDFLKRKDRPSQARVPRHVRELNIKDAFYTETTNQTVNNDQTPNVMIYHNKFVILVDDVIESGATMKDAMRALKEAGVDEVFGIALAK